MKIFFQTSPVNGDRIISIATTEGKIRGVEGRDHATTMDVMYFQVKQKAENEASETRVGDARSVVVLPAPRRKTVCWGGDVTDVTHD